MMEQDEVWKVCYSLSKVGTALSLGPGAVPSYAGWFIYLSRPGVGCALCMFEWVGCCVMRFGRWSIMDGECNFTSLGQNISPMTGWFTSKSHCVARPHEEWDCIKGTTFLDSLGSCSSEGRNAFGKLTTKMVTLRCLSLFGNCETSTGLAWL